MRDKRQPVLVGLQAYFPESEFFHLDRGDLEFICDELNRKPRGEPALYSVALIRLMEKLKECGGNLKKMMDGDPELAEVVKKVCGTRWMLSETGGAQLVLQPIEEHILEPGREKHMRPDRYAAMLFHVWTLNPEWDKLAGPCIHCGQYFLLKTERRTAYCSPRCHRLDSAARCTKDRNDVKHEEQLKRVRAKISEWDALNRKPKKDWKQWVSERLPAADKRVKISGAYHTVLLVAVTPKFLTRAINKHELKPPEKEQ